MGSISQDNKDIAHRISEVFGGSPKVHRYNDNDNTHYIDIVSCHDTPDDGVTSYSTVGLSQYNQGMTTNNKSINVEIVGACASEIEFFPQILASCAFNLIKEKQRLFPGAIIRNVGNKYDSEMELKHVLFSSPFLWDDKLKTLEFPDKYVAWLLAVPISDEELKYAVQYNTDSLESLFEEREIDIYDIYRDSAI